MQKNKTNVPASPIACQHCLAVIFDGKVISSRVIDPFRGLAKCRWCKQWTPVPVKYNSGG